MNTIQVTKETTTKEKVNLNLPAYFKDIDECGYIWEVSEDKVICLSENLATVYQKAGYPSRYNLQLIEAMRGEACSKIDFQNSLTLFLKNLNS